MKSIFSIITFLLIFILIIFNLPLSSFIIHGELLFTDKCSKNYTVKGEKTVDVYMCSDNSFGMNDNRGYAIIDGTMIKFDRTEVGSYSGKLLLHELGHSIGFVHQDRGIMKHDPSEPSRNNLTRKEKEIAKTFDNLRIIDWSNESDIQYMKEENSKHDFEVNLDYYIGDDCLSIYFEDKLYKDWWFDNRIYNTCGQ